MEDNTDIHLHRFTLNHKSDRQFFLIYVIAIWIVIVTGFGLDIVRKGAAHKLVYPLIIHAHAVVYVGWLILLTAQILLIRKRDYQTHRKLGQVAVILLPLMVVLGFEAPIVMDHIHRMDPNINLKLLMMSTQFTNIIGSMVLIIAGLVLRKDPSAHKRLMLMGTVGLTEPGFSRIIHHPLNLILGEGFWPYIIETYIGSITLMITLGAYDLITRKRLHPAFIFAMIWLLANEFVAAWLYYQPGWLTFTKQLIGKIGPQ